MDRFVDSVVLLLSAHVILASGFRILESPPLSCTQEGLRCKANINNDVDGETVDCGLTESMIAYLFDKSFKKQLKFRDFTYRYKEVTLTMEAFNPEQQTFEAPVSPANHSLEPTCHRLPAVISIPQFPQDVQSRLDAKEPVHKEQKYRNKIIATLYEMLSQCTMYPTHSDYVQVVKALIVKYPFLRDVHGSGYLCDEVDAIHPSAVSICRRFSENFTTVLPNMLKLVKDLPLKKLYMEAREDALAEDITDNCLDRGWLKHRDFTPTGPQKLTVNWDVREDENGDLVPVLLVNWKVQIDGSIKFLDGTEVNVLEMSINQNYCVRYIFSDKITAKKNSPDEEWSFSLDRVVVDPAQEYIISVDNLPKPNIDHDSFSVSKRVGIPGCAHARIMKTKMCVESGSLWMSNISLETTEGKDGKAAITVGFNAAMTPPSEKYNVAVECLSSNTEYQTIKQSNQTSLKATFALGKWPQTCCHFKVEIQPFFVLCKNDCIRRWKTFDICKQSPSRPTVPPSEALVAGFVFSVSAVLLCVAACCAYLHCRKRRKDRLGGKASQKAPVLPPKDSQDKPNTPRKVLLIYSLDHPLYKDIMLKLCGFLRAKCGTEVVLDLLDSAWLGATGRMQWLDWQKQQIEKSSDKILILCSRGVRAKWRAMCGEGRVMLREDLRSPMGDMLTPALSLIAPDLLKAAALEKYMVAYFEDVSCDDDVPAPFNITIKYKLMKHFEELYFRILDQEKHEPGRVNRIEGIGQDEYFKCPSGRALRDAIETFQAYQLDNPDWFEKECVDKEEEVAKSELQHPLLTEMCGNPIFQCVPEFKEAPPILVNELEFKEDARDAVQALIPLLSQRGEALSTSESHPGICVDQGQVYSLHSLVRHTPRVLDADGSLFTFKGQQPSVSAELALSEPAALRVNRLCPLEESPGESFPGEEEEEEPHTSYSIPSQESLERLRALQESLGPFAGPVPPCIEEKPIFDLEDRCKRVQQRRLLSGSDQGYISRSLCHGSALREVSQDPLERLSAGESFSMKSQDEMPTLTGHLSPTSLRQLQDLHKTFGHVEDIDSIPTGVVDHRKRPQSGSDQGYISRSCHDQDSMHRDESQNPLDALSRLQEACLLNSLAPSSHISHARH